MKKINIFKFNFVPNEIRTEFDIDLLDIVDKGILFSVLFSFNNYFNGGYTGIPYKKRYEAAGAKTPAQKRKADKFFQKYFYITEENVFFNNKTAPENDNVHSYENDNNQNNDCYNERVLKNDYICNIFRDIISLYETNKKNGKKGGRPSVKNASKATTEAKSVKNTIAENQKPTGYVFGYENTPKNKTENERQNNRTIEQVTNTNIEKCYLTNNNINQESVLVAENQSENSQILQIENFQKTNSENSKQQNSQNETARNFLFSKKEGSDSAKVENTEKDANQNLPREISNNFSNLNELQITFNFFLKMCPHFKNHMPNEVFSKTFQNGATLQDYRNAYQELSDEQKSSIKSINYLAAIVDKKQKQVSTTVIPVNVPAESNYNASPSNLEVVKMQLEISQNKRMSVLTFNLNKRRDELKQAEGKYLLQTGQGMSLEQKQQFILAGFTPADIQFMREQNVNLHPQPEMEIFDNQHKNDYNNQNNSNSHEDKYLQVLKENLNAPNATAALFGYSQ